MSDDEYDHQGQNGTSQANGKPAGKLSKNQRKRYDIDLPSLLPPSLSPC